MICATIKNIACYFETVGHFSENQQTFILPALQNVEHINFLGADDDYYWFAASTQNISAWAAMVIIAREKLQSVKLIYNFDTLGDWTDDNELRHENLFLGSIFPAMQAFSIKLSAGNRYLKSVTEYETDEFLSPIERHHKYERIFHDFISYIPSTFPNLTILGFIFDFSQTLDESFPLFRHALCDYIGSLSFQELPNLQVKVHFWWQ